MNKSILALTVVASFAAFAPAAQAGSWYGSYYGYGSSSNRTWCVDEDGDYYRCRKVYNNNNLLPSIPGIPGSLQRKAEDLLGLKRTGGCKRWSNSREAWVRTSCD
jgi:hypothetical protein